MLQKSGREYWRTLTPPSSAKRSTITRVFPEPAELAGILREALTDDSKVLIYRYLLAIAQADGEVSQEEQVLLATVAHKLGLATEGEQKAAA